ncbi:MAG: SMC family ATPase [Peptostreptococcaceae bacterium]|nr:SMC family ATPase [Peptostreptococcaceae bacterium]
MKPIKLEMRGINSFRETQTVDFSRLTERGIFGIFGPTGSGKSTILDAMTLALYNETARKSREYINMDGNDLFVSFEFEVGTDSGRVVYVVERGKKRAVDGTVKSTITRFYRKDGKGEILEKTGTVNNAIVDLIGLTMDDFTRSVVIPQGKFSDFLKLTGANRRKMLERILRLQEFGELLTVRVKKKNLENEKKLYGVKEGLEAYSNLEMDKLDDFKVSLKLIGSNLEDLSKKEEKMRSEVERSNEFWKKKIILDSIEGMLKESKAQEKDMEDLLDKCEKAKKVKEMGPYMKEKKEALKEIASIDIFVGKMNKDLENNMESKLQSEKKFKEATAKKEENYEPLFSKSIVMRHLMENEIKRVKELEKNLRLEEESIKKNSKDMNAVKSSIEGRVKKIEELRHALDEKKQELESLAREHLVMTIGKKLLVGDACPICGSEIKEFTFMKMEETDGAKERMDSLENELQGLQKTSGSQERKWNEEKETVLRLAYDAENFGKRYKINLEEKEKLLKRIDEVFKRQNPEAALLDVKMKMEKLVKDEKDVAESLNTVNKGISDIRESLNESVRSMERNKERLRIASKSLAIEMEKAGMAKEDEIAGFIIGDIELESMENQYGLWDKQRVRLNVQKDDVLADLEKIDVCGNRDDFEKLKKEFKDIQTVKEESNEKFIRFKERIEQMERNLEKVKELEKKKKQMEKNADLLKEIMDLLRGNAFVGFVAMRHLRYIVRDATVRLLDITGGRYRLEIDSQGEFVICDHFNGGTRRGCDTLSGGETFIVSLALALALSAKIQMNRANSLEFFFLDEGFGTLDKGVLDVVMDSLERIREKDLSVGLISHVEALKDRVPVKLVVEPAEPGVSGSRLRMEYM